MCMAYDPFIAPITIMLTTSFLIGVPLGMLLKRKRVDSTKLVIFMMLWGATVLDLLILNWIMSSTYASNEVPILYVTQLRYYLLPGIVFAIVVAAYVRSR